MKNAPHLPKIERATLAAMLRNNSNYELAIGRGITVDSFHVPENRHVFEAIAAEISSGGVADVLTVTKRIGNEMASYVVELELDISTTVNFDDWTRQLKMVEAVRRSRVAAMKFLDAVESGSCDYAGTIGNLTAEASASMLALTGQKERTLREIARDHADYYRQEHIEIPYFPDGTKGAAVMHQHRRELHVVCANSGVGKTCFAIGASQIQLNAGLRVAYFCTESDSEAIMERFAAQISGVSHWVLQKKFKEQQEFEQFVDAMYKTLPEQYKNRLFIFGSETRLNTPEAMRGALERIVSRVGGIDVVVLDYVQNVKTPAGAKITRQIDRVDYAIEAFHAIATDFDAHVLVLSQINKEGQKDGVLPNLEHVKDSSTVVNLAHTVSFLYRKKSTGGNNPDEKTLFYSGKTRNQPPFRQELSWNKVGYVSPNRCEAGAPD